jgi:3-oxoacyl-[acyl-carrier-protein] synthase-3
MISHWLVLEPGRSAPPAPHRARIAGAGRCLPDAHLGTDELMASTRHRTHIDLERLTGVRDRRVCTGAEDSLSLATEAATDCLTRSGRSAADLDAVIYCGITKIDSDLVQWLEPTMSLALARRIGADRAMTFDLSNACAGMLTGVCVLNTWIRHGVVERGLVISGEYISQLAHNAARHVRNVMSRELASLTVGDAGAALLLERAPAGAGCIELTGFTTIADHSRLCMAYPRGKDPAARMFTDSRGIQRMAIADTPPLLREALEAAGLGLDDVDWVITHQTSVRAIRQGTARCFEELGGTPRHEPVITVDRYGNTASTTHAVALVEQLRAGAVRPGETVALIALASGLEIGVVLFTVDGELVGGYGHTD